MKRLLYPLLFISVLIYWGCEDKKDDNTPEVVEDTPTEVTLWGVVYSVENTTELFLWDNQLTGSIPQEIGYLTNLTYLSLSFNQLTDSIPPEIGNLTNLTYLDLSNNQLTGTIPPEIGNLTNLTYLSFLFNKLTGEIPDSICNLNIDWGQPGSFSISNNQLCSPYPSCLVSENENYNYMGTQDTSGCD